MFDERDPIEVEDLTPRQIVAALDRHVVGQADAKRAVAIALRNRWRRQQLAPDVAEEIVPKNILMIGPTGVGKTEIARRLAKLAKAPFIKIEASKFTEVGYVGRDVESMVRDLIELAVGMVREEKKAAVEAEATQRAQERLLDLLLPPQGPSVTPGPAATSRPGDAPAMGFSPDPGAQSQDDATSMSETREKLRRKLERGELEDRRVELDVADQGSPSFEMFTPQGVEEVGFNLREMMPGLFGKKTRKDVSVAEARALLLQEEAEKLVDRHNVAEEARHRVEQSGIIFIDEIDKVCSREGQKGPDVSREGVQRDLLPIVEGTVVNTKHGMVRTDHILFIAAGAFHVAKPSDMIPELQGRFPIRVELNALTQNDFVRILTEPQSALTTQYRALLSTEEVTIDFSDEAIEEIARMAVEVNSSTENIGARRLATLMERLLEEVSFGAPDMAGVTLTVDKNYVKKALDGIVEDTDISRYVL